MRINLVRQKNKTIKSFETREWHLADAEIFNKRTDWRKKEHKFVAYNDKRQIVGVLNLKIKAKVALIKTLIVAKKARRSGIGKALILKAEELSKKSGAHKIYLETGEKWKTVKFYESLGYKKAGLLKNHYFNQNFVFFEKFLYNRKNQNPV